MNAADVRAAVAAAVATLLGAFALLPVFATGAWFGPVAATVLVVLAGGLALRAGVPVLWARATGGRPVSARASGAGIALVPLGQLLLVTWLLEALYAPDRLFGGMLPTWRGVRAVAGVLSDGSAELQEQSTPALPLHGLLALTVVLVGLVAVAVDLIAVAGRQAALAGVGLLVLYCVPVSTITGGIGLLPIVAPAAALALLLWTDQRRRLVRRSRSSSGRLGAGAGGLTAARIGLLAIVGGLVVGSAVPTLAEGSFASGSGTAGGGGKTSSVGTSLDPVAALKGQLTLPDPVDLLRVKADVSDPGYLRALSLDTYVPDRGWTLANLDDEQTIAGDPDLAPLPGRQTGRIVRATIRSISHDDKYLPVLSSPTTVTVRGAGSSDWRYDPASSTVFGRGVTTAGRTYTVVADEPRPSVGLLEASPALGAGNPVLRRYTQLPPLDPSVTQLVATLTADARTPYEQVTAIDEYFADPSNGFVYSLSTKPGTSRDDLVNFLADKQGYCEQFAGAMAVLVRAAGIPARVAMGYTPGTEQPDGSRLITSHDAHSWVEVYFADLGWVPFDPTPVGAGRAVALPWAPQRHTPDPAQDPAVASAGAAPAQSLRSAVIDRADQQVALTTSAQPGRPVLPFVLGGVALLLVVLAVATPPLLRLRQRRRRLADDGAGALWDELAATARDLGIGWDRSRTPRQTARQLAELIRGTSPAGSDAGRRVRRPDQADAAVDAVRRLALAEEAASYAPPGSDPDTAALASALKTARRGLQRAVPRAGRLRAALWPASLTSGLAAGASARIAAGGSVLLRRLPVPGRRSTRTV